MRESPAAATGEALQCDMTWTNNDTTGRLMSPEGGVFRRAVGGVPSPVPESFEEGGPFAVLPYLPCLALAAQLASR